MRKANGTSLLSMISHNEGVGLQIDFLTNQINIQENEAAISIYNDLVAKYDNKVLVELQSAGSTFQPSQEGM